MFDLFRKPIQSSPAATAVAEPETSTSNDNELVTAPINLRTEDIDIETQHTKLAEKLGVYAKPQVAWRKLASVLAEEMIQVYDLEKVKAYMTKKAAKEGRVWQWFPLRKADEPRPIHVPNYDPFESAQASLIRAMQGSGQAAQWFSSPSPFGSFSQTRYTEAVPLPVLLTVDRLVDRLGEDAEFLVAALGGPIDPFLAVRSKSDPQHTMFVIERWDEPGFRG